MLGISDASSLLFSTIIRVVLSTSVMFACAFGIRELDSLEKLRKAFDYNEHNISQIYLGGNEKIKVKGKC